MIKNKKSKKTKKYNKKNNKTIKTKVQRAGAVKHPKVIIHTSEPSPNKSVKTVFGNSGKLTSKLGYASSSNLLKPMSSVSKLNPANYKIFGNSTLPKFNPEIHKMI